MVTNMVIDENKFNLLVGTARNNSCDSYLRCKAITDLTKTKSRKLYPLFIEILQDCISRGNEKYVRLDALLSLGRIEDSRSFFPLINYYESADYEERCKILMAFDEFCDPRSRQFLEIIISTSKNDIKQLATSAYNKVTRNLDLPFLYRYILKEEDRIKAESSTGMINVESIDSLHDKKNILFHSLNSGRPQTYIVLPSGSLFVGGFLHEHVIVARGNDVMAAGEINFDNKFNVIYMNNRSNGYYPDGYSIKFLKHSLDSAKINHSSAVIENFPINGFLDSDILRNFSFYKETST